MEKETKVSFKDKRTIILDEFENFIEKIKTITSFNEALKECEIFFLSLTNQHAIDKEYLETKGSDEFQETHPVSKSSFHYIPTRMSEIFMRDWKSSESTEQFVQYFVEFDRIWNLLGVENRKIISCTNDMMDRFFGECYFGNNIPEFQRFLHNFDFSQIRAVSKVSGKDRKEVFLQLLDKELKKHSLEKVIEIITLNENPTDRETLYVGVAKRDDFKKLSFEEMKNVVDKTRSIVLAKKLLSRNDIPVELFLLNVATTKIAS
jgi:hypothetical protein